VGQNITAVYIGENPPNNIVKGTLWIDTSNNQFILKSYDGTTWQIVQADLYWDKIDGGNL
jgi:CTP:phosphocholine cytidylyltransferase-like protein